MSTGMAIRKSVLQDSLLNPAGERISGFIIRQTKSVDKSSQAFATANIMPCSAPLWIILE